MRALIGRGRRTIPMMPGLDIVIGMRVVVSGNRRREKSSLQYPLP
jgi:hypothetical protein